LIFRRIIMDKRIYTNAALSYFFMGFLFWIARNNPIYGHEYIQYHAKKATRLHAIFFASAILYFSFVSPLLFSIPRFGDWMKYGGDTLFLVSMTCILLYHANKAFSGAMITESFSQPGNGDEGISFGLKAFSVAHIPEQQKVLFLVSGIPYIGLLFEEQSGVPMARFGAFFGGSITVIFSLLYIFFPFTASYLFVPYVAVMVFIGINLIVRNRFVLPPKLF